MTRWREDVTRGSVGHVRLPARRRERRGLVGRLPADAASSRPLRGDVLGGPRGDPSARRRDRDRARGRRLARGRRRGPARLGHEPRVTGSASIELTSYAEVVLAPPAADAAHPAFSNLFVQTELVADLGALLATRRAALAGGDRGLGRPRRRGGRRARRAASSTRPTGPASSAAAATIRTPMSVDRRRPLSNTAGSVLDPIFSLRRRVRLAPARARPAHVLDAGRAVARDRARRWPTSTATPRPSSARSRWPGPRPRSSSTTWASSPTRRTSSSELASRILYSDPSLRAAPDVLATQQRPAASALWAARHLGRPADRAGAHRRAGGSRASSASSCAPTSTGGMKRLAVDLVILNEQAHVLRPGAAGRARGPGADEPVGAAARAQRGPRAASSSCAADLLLADGTRPCRRRRGPCSSSRHGTLAEQVARAERQPSAAAARAARRSGPRRPRRGAARRAPSSSSSTASAASRTGAAST